MAVAKETEAGKIGALLVVLVFVSQIIVNLPHHTDLNSGERGGPDIRRRLTIDAVSAIDEISARRIPPVTSKDDESTLHSLKGEWSAARPGAQDH